MPSTPGHPALSPQIAWAGRGRPVGEGFGGGRIVGAPPK
jgi:hypothetical protein